MTERNVDCKCKYAPHRPKVLLALRIKRMIWLIFFGDDRKWNITMWLFDDYYPILNLCMRSTGKNPLLCVRGIVPISITQRRTYSSVGFSETSSTSSFCRLKLELRIYLLIHNVIYSRSDLMLVICFFLFAIERTVDISPHMLKRSIRHSIIDFPTGK